MRLEVSSHCQLRCPSCPTTSGAIDAAIGKGFLRFDDFKALVDANPSVRQIELANYGEVFLNPDLKAILEYAHEGGVRLSIGTGANLNFAREDVLEALVRTRLATLTCSIDGAHPGSYATYRVRGDLARVLANIETINRFKRIYRSKQPFLVWQFVAFGFNEDEIAEAKALATELDMSFKLKLTWDDSFSPLKDPARLIADFGLPARNRAEYREKEGADYMESICEQMWDSPQINWNGDVLGCCRNFWGRFGGNAFRDGLPAAMNSEGMNYARAMLAGEAPPRDDIRVRPATSISSGVRTTAG